MKISPYFEETKQLTALNRYAEFTTARNRDWSIGESKLDMYRLAKRAFDGKSEENCRRGEFDKIYGNLKSWWRISRNGNLASAEMTFALLSKECLDCSRSKGLTLMNLREASSQQIVVDCLREVRELKKLKSGAFPVMAVSKFLHFFNPKLFVIWDREIIYGEVYPVFRQDWNAAYRDIKVGTDDEWMKFYLAYLLWAGKSVQECSQKSMQCFSNWFVDIVSSGRDAEDFRRELQTYYATAFEFVAIGAAYLEKNNGKPGNGKCSKGKSCHH